MKPTFKTTMAVILGVSLVGCSNVDMNKSQAGAVIGGVAGGVVGNQFGQGAGKLLATGVGVVAGSLIGSAIGKSMDDTDRLKMSQTLENNPSGQPTYWKNQNTGDSYTVTPVSNVTIKGNPYCREYRTVAEIAGKKQQLYGTACRQQDGTWRTVS